MFAVEFDTDSLSLLIAPQDEPAALDRLLEGDSAFVWGLLINPRLIRELTGHWLPFAPARIEGYRRSVLRDGDRLDLRLEPESGSCVDGVLLLGLSREDRAALDGLSPKDRARHLVELWRASRGLD